MSVLFTMTLESVQLYYTPYNILYMVRTTHGEKYTKTTHYTYSVCRSNINPVSIISSPIQEKGGRCVVRFRQAV